MTASIVGWAHTPFGKFDAETVESLVVKVATEALADAGIRPRSRRDRARPFQCRLLAAGFYGLPRAAGRRQTTFQTGDARRECLRHRLAQPCSRASAPIAAGAAKFVLVVGVEQMTADAVGESGRNLLKRLLPAGGGRDGRRLRRRVRQDRAAAISRIMATSRTRSRRSPPRTTRTASATPTRRCARTSASTSAAPRSRRIL